LQISSLNKKLHEHIYAEKLQNICNVYFHKLISIKHLFILLSGLEIIQEIKMPKTRDWYYNKDNRYLGTDLLSIK
jgi:hypothetical protein